MTQDRSWCFCNGQNQGLGPRTEEQFGASSNQLTFIFSPCPVFIGGDTVQGLGKEGCLQPSTSARQSLSGPNLAYPTEFQGIV